MIPDAFAADCAFIGPPVGWFGRSDRFPLGHISLLNRFVAQRTSPDGWTSLEGIGPRLDMP